MYLKTLKQLQQIKNKNLKVGLCHGVFDILHNGHIEHFISAKKQVDILVVSVTTEKFVNKGPRQPINNDKKRVNMLNSIKYIDYVFLNKDKNSANIIKALKPDIYFKGPDYLKSDSHGNLKKEVAALKNYKGKIQFTETHQMSSTSILNNTVYNWTSEQKNILKKLGNSNAYEKIIKKINCLSSKSITIIGEPIIDIYNFCEIKGITTKDPAISTLFKKKLSVAGGVLTIAKIASLFAKQVNLITYGNKKILQNFFKDYNNINITNIDAKERIQIKSRFLNYHRHEKLLQITNFSENSFSKNININPFLKKIKTKEIIICDFGLGLFNLERIHDIEKSNFYLHLNVQTNSINQGFNLFTKYKNYKYISLDEREWKLGTNSNHLNIEKIKKLIGRKVYASITLGSKGSCLLKNNKNIYSPTFVENIKDTTGCGDAYFIITSMLLNVDTDINLIPFLGNLYAGMHGQNLGNSKIVSKIEFLKNLNSILKF